MTVLCLQQPLTSPHLISTPLILSTVLVHFGDRRDGCDSLCGWSVDVEQRCFIITRITSVRPPQSRGQKRKAIKYNTRSHFQERPVEVIIINPENLKVLHGKTTKTK